jgi:hypothetical protein
MFFGKMILMKENIFSKIKQISAGFKSKAMKEEVEILDKDEAVLVQLKKINRRLRLLTSLKHSFLRSLVQGIATTIGATIIAGLLILFLSKFIKSVQDVPILNSIIKNSNIEQIIGQ